MLSRIKETNNFQVIFKSHLQTTKTLLIISDHRIKINLIIFNHSTRVKIN